MKTRHTTPFRAGLTLLEILAVIAIIAILASILIPAIVRSKVRAKIGMARIDCQTIASSIKQYYDDYKRYPKSNPWIDDKEGKPIANTLGGDLTFSLPNKDRNCDLFHNIDPPNSHVISILIDDTKLDVDPDPDKHPNKNHRGNFEKTRYFEPKLVSGYDEQGIGPDGIFRDPFGNPYVVTVDLNNDDKCCDWYYEKPGVSGIDVDGNGYERIGHHGLMRETINQQELFALPGTVMVWSVGPDREFGGKDCIKNIFNYNAKEDFNYDNIIGWE